MIAVTGAGGLIGSALLPALRLHGEMTRPLVRRPAGSHEEIEWRPESDRLSLPELEGATAVIHLAGAPLAGARWTPERKKLIETSRTLITGSLASALLKLNRPPPVFICASAVGFYGPDATLPRDESSPPGQGFLAQVCRKWEAAADPLRDHGIRVVHLRFGLVLSGRGGLLAQLRPVFRHGLGGPLGSGRQIMSWISETDTVAAILHVLEHEEIAGGVNLTSPNPVSNREFARALGHAWHRPARIRIPAFVLRAVLGDMAEETLLASARIRPRVLLESGYRFRHPKLDQALDSCL